MRTLWPFGAHRPSDAAEAAGAAAQQSYDDAVVQRDRMARLRAEADQATAAIKAHNTANRYDSWLQGLIQDGKR